MATIPLPSRRSRLAVATIFFVNGAVLASWVAHIPGVKERHGIGDGSLGFVLLFMALGAVLALPLGGWLVDRFGSRLITSLAALVFCLALPWPLLSRDVTCLVTALVLLGACTAVLDVSMNAQAVAVELRYQRSIMSSFHALWSLGGVVGAALSGLAMSLDALPERYLVATAIVAAAFVSGTLGWQAERSEEHTSELQSRLHLVCRLLLEKKKTNHTLTGQPSNNARRVRFHTAAR